MGIVAYCPNGHRVKVKDELAGRRGICPECQSRFRVPRGEAMASGHPVARVVSLDPAVAAGLPRAVAITAAAGALGMGQGEQLALPRAVATGPQSGGAPRRDRPPPPALHPALAERREATWSIAKPGGEASAAMSAEALQSFLDAGGLTGDELVWREGWAEWVSIRLVFPEYLPSGG